MYGESPAPISAEVLETILGGDSPITHRPADDLAPEMEAAKAEIGDLAENIDDVLSYVMFPQPAREFLQWRKEGGGPDRELVAAVIGAMVIGEKRAAAASPAQQPIAMSANGASPGSTWRNFGRLRQMQ
jgi:pyruvate/oxaloacetate carboxyltransferase